MLQSVESDRRVQIGIETGRGQNQTMMVNGFV